MAGVALRRVVLLYVTIHFANVVPAHGQSSFYRVPNQYVENEGQPSGHVWSSPGAPSNGSLCRSSSTRVTKATAYISGYSARSGEISGQVNFTEQSSTSNIIVIEGEIIGLPPGLHGMNIEESGNPNEGCASAGVYYGSSSQQTSNGGESTDTKRYAGDLNNIDAGSSGTAIFRFTDNQLPLNGADSIIGRMVVIYEQPDDYGENGRNGLPIDASDVGNPRIACGVIGIQTEVDVDETNTASSSSAAAGASSSANPSYASASVAVGAGGRSAAFTNMAGVLSVAVLSFLTAY